MKKTDDITTEVAESEFDKKKSKYYRIRGLLYYVSGIGIGSVIGLNIGTQLGRNWNIENITNKLIITFIGLALFVAGRVWDNLLKEPKK